MQENTPKAPLTLSTGAMQTFTGARFDPVNPSVDAICIIDIAHALSLICRFGGHCNYFYSVAQHSVWVSRHLPEPLRLKGLLHDATEAYIGDMIRPLKMRIPQFQQIEQNLWHAICLRFDLTPEMEPEIKVADNLALMTERAQLKNPPPESWGEDLERIIPDPHPLVDMNKPPGYNRDTFLLEFFKLTAGKKFI